MPLDQWNCKVSLEFLFAWGQIHQGLGVGPSLYRSHSTSGSGSALFLSTEDWRLVFPWLELKMSHWSRTKQTCVEQNKAGQRQQEQAELTRAKQSCPTGKVPHLRPPHSLLLHSCAALGLSYYTIELFSSPALLTALCITAELFPLNKVSVFTAPKVGNSCWH